MRRITKFRSVLFLFVFLWVTNICFSSGVHSATDRDDLRDAQALSNALMVGTIVCLALAVGLGLSSHSDETLAAVPEPQSFTYRPLISIKNDLDKRQQDLIFGISFDF